MQRVGQNSACHVLPAAIVPLQSPCYEPRGIRGSLSGAQNGSKQSLPCFACCPVMNPEASEAHSLVPRVGQNRAFHALPAAVRGSLCCAQSGSEQSLPCSSCCSQGLSVLSLEWVRTKPSMLCLLLSEVFSLVPKVDQNRAFHALPAAIGSFIPCVQVGSEQSIPCFSCKQECCLFNTCIPSFFSS